MQILNFTEPLIKPALQDRSKCFTIRKAWDWVVEAHLTKTGNQTYHYSKTKWVEQQECRHKVGALEKIMWMQRGKNDVCINCAISDPFKDCIKPLPCFTKVFGVGKILQTLKVWMVYANDMLKIKVDGYHLDFEEFGVVSKQDGFKSYDDFSNFFIKQYPIITEHWMPFWRIKWEWQPQSL